MNQTTYTRAHLNREARFAVDAFRRTLPAACRRSVKYDDWTLRVGDNTALVAQFHDENGPHDINIAI
jgi:hypothetical protein